jgi:hypothetical protein
VGTTSQSQESKSYRFLATGTARLFVETFKVENQIDRVEEGIFLAAYEFQAKVRFY